MDIINLSISLNIFLSFLVLALSIYMGKHVWDEYQQVKKLKNGRRALNTILMVMFIVMAIDALRGSLIYVLHSLGQHSDLLTLINLFAVDLLNLVRVIFLAGFVKITAHHYINKK